MSRVFVRGIGAVSPAGWGVGALRDCLAAGAPLATQPMERPLWPQPLPYRTVPALKPSAGQVLFVPSQFSATSQAPAEARHSTVLAFTPSAGQVGVVPSQTSATSQTPLAARQVVPAASMRQ